MLVLATIASAFVSPARAQLSPGALSRSHETIDNALSCFKCHGGGEDSLDRKCLECHGEISWLVGEKRGLHGRPAIGDCASCHVEHVGREPSLVRFKEGSPEQFDHNRAGWPLTGKHATTKCESCHKVEFRKSEAARLSERKDLANSYIGLETECTACHVDPHRGSLGTDCRQCHLTTTWEATPGFDHDKTDYPLTGKHVKVACEKCHKQSASASGSAPKKVFKSLPHAECSDCHRDVHQGRAGPSCTSCHVTDNFRQFRNVEFDHSRTDYPLEGKHVKVACQDCHKLVPRGGLTTPGPLETGAARSLRHQQCVDCHQDAHGGQLANRHEQIDCASCHRVQGWKPSTFTVARHAELSFSLEGRHATAECVTCHGPQSKGPARAMSAESLGSARVALVLGQATCIACHTDPHRGRFDTAGAKPMEGCRDCHGLDAFRPSTLTASEHEALGFSLEGAHSTVTCDRCHKEIRPTNATPEPEPATSSVADPLVFPAENSCEACHRNKDPHGDQFASRRDNGACGSCHGEQAFKPATRFDHDRDTLFPLLRSHNDVECQTCHPSQPGASGALVVIYSPTTFDCKECHRRTAPSLPERATAFSSAAREPTRKKKKRRRR